jgi:hypothetical protein
MAKESVGQPTSKPSGTTIAKSFQYEFLARPMGIEGLTAKIAVFCEQALPPQCEFSRSKANRAL